METPLSEEHLVPGPSRKAQPRPARRGRRWVGFEDQGLWGRPRPEGLDLQEPLLSSHHHFLGNWALNLQSPRCGGPGLHRAPGLSWSCRPGPELAPYPTPGPLMILCGPRCPGCVEPK